MAGWKRAARLPRGGYAYRGRAVRFSALPAKQRHAWRVYWGHKAQRTWQAHRAEILEGINASESTILSGEMRRKGMRSFAADAMPGRSLAEHIEVVADLAAREFPEGRRGSWMLVLDWPQDERSEPGDPFQTRVSRQYSYRVEYNRQQAKKYFQEYVFDHPDAWALPGDPAHPSRGYGQPELHAVYYMALPDLRRKVKKPKKERRRRRR